MTERDPLHRSAIHMYILFNLQSEYPRDFWVPYDMALQVA